MALISHLRFSGLYVNAPPDVVANCLVQWGNETRVNRFTTAERQKFRFEQSWTHLGQGKPDPDRAILVPLGNWTGFFDNHIYGWIAIAELFVLCSRLKVDTCFFSYNNQPDSVGFGNAQFNHCSYIGGTLEVKQRQVMLTKDGSWQFQQVGLPLSFENTSAYTRPKKKERLNSEMLRDYGVALGIPFWDLGAYGQDVVLLRWGRKPDGADGESDSALKRILSVLGRPSAIMDRFGIRPPPSE